MDTKQEHVESMTDSPPVDMTSASDSSEKNNTFDQGHHVETSTNDSLTPEHRQYLMERHGTVDLEPLPSMDPVDPLNWPNWKKNTNLFLVSFHAMMTTFTAAAIIPAFEDLSIALKISLTQASYLTAIQILILGVSPLLWKPVSNTYGRRPVWLISTFGSMICNIGCSESKTYPSQVITRMLVSFFISPAIAISSAVVAETFFKRERGLKMGVWTVMVTLGPPTGPFLMGFVAYQTGNWQWIYRILAITNAVQFILYLLLSHETLYIRQNNNLTSTLSRIPSVAFKQVSASPLNFADFWRPLTLFTYPNILLPTIAYTLVFSFAGILLTVEIPQIFTPAFKFNSQQIGLQFVGMIIGAILGEQIGGRGSDFIMRPSRSSSKQKKPEYRLWLSYPGFLCAIVGLIVFCIQTDRAARRGRWDVTPIVGIAIATFGNQIVTTVVTTYCVDCHAEVAGSIGVFINLVRSTWGFIGPFWFPDMFDNLGLNGSAGLMVGILAVFAVVPTMWIQWRGEKIRMKE